MNSHFQSLFENVCRCFGHTPTSRGTTVGELDNSFEDIDVSDQNRQSITTVNSEASSTVGKKRTNKLKLNDKQYDELFDKAQRVNNAASKEVNAQPSRSGEKRNKKENDEGRTSISDHDTARALAKAKLAANPPRYRTKRKRPSQTREEIFRNKNGNSRLGSASCINVGGGKPSAASSTRNEKKTSSLKTDFSRLLNPSLALCFATPIRGTEEEQEEQDLKSLDHSDTATLNTNGDDTITSTLYFDSKYAHIQESTPPMPLFSQFKIGQAKDEIRTIMATDSHSSVRMIKIMKKNQQQHQAPERGQEHTQKRTPTTTTALEGIEGDSSSNSELEQQQLQQQQQQNVLRNQSNPVEKLNPMTNTKGASRRMKEKIKITSDGHDGDEEMEDAVPDVKPLSSSTDSSRFSNNATKETSIQ